jgi:hypothetical protein
VHAEGGASRRGDTLASQDALNISEAQEAAVHGFKSSHIVVLDDALNIPEAPGTTGRGFKSSHIAQDSVLDISDAGAA